jgi:hypothetical protein
MVVKSKPEIEGTNIVLLGDFNPKIFQPAWFAAQQLIRNEEADDANIELIHQAFVRFSLEWLRVEIHQNRFLAATHLSPYYKVLRDLVVGTFRILKHTPVRMMGINADFHFPLPSEDAWHAIGHRLAPKDMWNKLLNKPGMRSLSMEGHRPDDYIGRITVRVEPSTRIEYGVYVHVNDHYAIKDQESSLGCDEIIDILESSWEKSISRSKEIAHKILEQQ